MSFKSFSVFKNVVSYFYRDITVANVVSSAYDIISPLHFILSSAETQIMCNIYDNTVPYFLPLVIIFS